MVEFEYNGRKVCIQCNPEELINNIIQKFIIKVGKNLNNILFLYGGEKVKEELKFSELANEEDKRRNKMCFIVFELEENILSEENINKSKYIICPECKENIRLSVLNDKITLYDCINFHNFKNLSLNEFGITQNIDESKIICGKCSISKSKTYKHSFYICYSCKFNLCPICMSSHNKTHYINDYELKNFICKVHLKSFSSYCEYCRKDICIICQREHLFHKILSYKTIIPNVEKIKKQIEYFKAKIDEYKDFIDEIIEKLNNVKDNYDAYYQIYNHIIDNYENKNYAVLKNMNDVIIYINDSINKINKIINDSNIKITISKLFNIDMSGNLLYSPNENEKDDEIYYRKRQKNEVNLASNNSPDAISYQPMISTTNEIPYLTSSSSPEVNIQPRLSLPLSVPLPFQEYFSPPTIPNPPPIPLPEVPTIHSTSRITVSKRVFQSKEEELNYKMSSLKKVGYYTNIPYSLKKIKNNVSFMDEKPQKERKEEIKKEKEKKIIKEQKESKKEGNILQKQKKEETQNNQNFWENIKFKNINNYNKYNNSKNNNINNENNNINMNKKNNNVKTNNNIINNNNNEIINLKNITMDKYESFDIANIQKISEFEKYYMEINLILVLNDSRILISVIDHKNERRYLYICGYNMLQYNIIYELKDGERINDMIQMNDNNIIAKIYNSNSKIFSLKILRIKNGILELIQNINIEPNTSGLLKLFSNKIIIFNNINRSINFYQYENESIIDIDHQIHYYIHNLCEINENEIAIYCRTKGKIYGYNDSLIFYDIKKDEENNSLKIADNLKNDSSLRYLSLLNKNTIILQHNSCIYLVDSYNRKIIRKIRLDYEKITSILILNERNFLVAIHDKIYQYILDKENNVNLKGINFDCPIGMCDECYLYKYPGNKIIKKSRKGIYIYG